MSDPAIVTEIGQYVRQMRLNRNLTQKQLAKMSGVNRVTISKFEGGRASTLLTLVQILRALDKLSILNTFYEEAEISPLQLLNLKKKQRKRATGSRRFRAQKSEGR
ncbi:MAG: helix-turn-helix transcriptional regulator [candidate division Zixibacteria bacterium]|nr:helix-turn-helix transcriptional regulator [candidate division Zixibacteria bacterium]